MRVGIIISRDGEKRYGQKFSTESGYKLTLQHGGFPATSGSKNKKNITCPFVVNDVFDKTCFVNKVGTQIPSHIGEERRIHNLQDTAAVIMRRSRTSRFEIATPNGGEASRLRSIDRSTIHHVLEHGGVIR